MPEIIHEILLFAALRERAGTSTVRVRVADPGTVADLLRALAEQVPRIASALPHCRVALDHAFVDDDHALLAGTEIAVIPPVSGGHDGARIVLTESPLVIDAAIATVLGDSRGGVATFCGYVRRHSRGRDVAYLEYEAYAPMAIAVMAAIVRQVEDATSGAHVAIHHRLGRLEIGECAVVVAAATPHRSGAFTACRLAIEALKRDVPIWKREVAPDGASWVGLGP